MVSRMLRSALKSRGPDESQHFESQANETVSVTYPRFPMPFVPATSLGGRHFVYAGYQAHPVKQVLQMPWA